jgi:hypothetical protein
MNRTPRLAELIVHLTDCAPDVAVGAVTASTTSAPQNADDALAVVARALCSIRRLDLVDAVDLREQPKVHAK